MQQRIKFAVGIGGIADMNERVAAASSVGLTHNGPHNYRQVTLSDPVPITSKSCWLE